MIYHLSIENLNNKTLKPRIPNCRLDNEDSKTKRVCFSRSICGAYSALNSFGGYNTLYVHVPYDENVDYIKPTKEQVEDVKSTKEVWVTKPVKLKCIAKINIGFRLGTWCQYGDKPIIRFKYLKKYSEG